MNNKLGGLKYSLYIYILKQTNMIRFNTSPYIQKWDNTEVHPIMILPDETHTHCEPNEATYWSVFIHFEFGGLENIADFETEAMANEFEYLINKIVNNKVN